MKELVKIQSELNAPKSQTNTFGGYMYRSCEDILAAVKPLLLETGCVLLLSDEIKEIGSPYEYDTSEVDKYGKSTTTRYNGSRFYVEATATLINPAGDSVSVKAYAREEVAKKGSDASQVTGAASSYARKYALNGLFAIDDVKDADATNKHGKDETSATATTTKTTRTTANKAASSQPSVRTQVSDAVDNEQMMLQFAKDELSQALNKEELKAVVDKYPTLRANKEFLAAGTARKKALGIQ